MNDLTTEIIAGVHLMSGSTHRSMSLENPNLPLNAPEIWESVFGDSFMAATGETMTAEKSFTIGAVWQAVSLISGDVAKLPLTLYKESSAGVREEVKGNSLTNVLQYQPNSEENAFKFWRRVMVHALIWNNAYITFSYGPTGEIEELFHLLPDRTIMARKGGELWCITEVDGEKVYIPSKYVIHMEGISWDGLQGADFARAARNSWALALAQEKFASKFFKHGGRVGGILEIPLGANQKAQGTIEEGFRKTYEGADNPFRTVILRDNAKFHAAQTSPADSQLVEGTEQQVRQIARWFNLSPSKLGLSDSVSYNSKAEDNQAYLDSTLSHWLKPIAMECTSKLLTVNQQKRMWLEHDTTELLRMNPTQRAAFYLSMIQATVLSPNDARRMENMQPYEGGDKYENPNTSKGMSATETRVDPAKRSDESHNIARVIYHIGSNARHKAQRPAAFIEWIDGNLVTHRSECRAIGVSESVIDPMVSGLKQLAATCDHATLPVMVDKFMSQHERAV